MVRQIQPTDANINIDATQNAIDLCFVIEHEVSGFLQADFF